MKLKQNLILGLKQKIGADLQFLGQKTEDWRRFLDWAQELGLHGFYKFGPKIRLARISEIWAKNQVGADLTFSGQNTEICADFFLAKIRSNAKHHADFFKSDLSSSQTRKSARIFLVGLARIFGGCLTVSSSYQQSR